MRLWPEAFGLVQLTVSRIDESSAGHPVAGNDSTPKDAIM
jgi:hypothetical protein